MHAARPFWFTRLALPMALITVFASAANAENEAATLVFLNGVPTPVHFNDGDSFRVLEGPLAGSKARLRGFNTMESYGGVHQWGDWTPHELYLNAKMGTLNARKGQWRCEADLNDKDGYGRVLWWCEDLAIDQVRKGLAHALTIDAEPADAVLIAAQKEAIKERAGMWAHGVPSFILTSTHSASEGGGGDGRTSNRLVSTRDGHSEMWVHNDSYSECENVCLQVKHLSKDTLTMLVAAAREGLPQKFETLSDRELARRIQNMVDIGQVGWMDTKDDAIDLSQYLEGVLKKTQWEPERIEQGSCMIYIDFRRRYGSKRASCLNH